jgi:hypothetical protein
VGQVTTTFFADSQAAEAAIAKLETKYAKLEEKLKGISRTSREDARAASQGVEEWAGKIGGAILAYTGLSNILQTVAQAQQEVNRKADEGVLKYDELNRRLRVQAGLSGVQGQQAQERLTQIALRTGVDYGTAARGAEELISQGFSAEQGTGTALERLLQTMQATNARPEDIKLLAQSYSALLAGTGQEKNTANLEDVSRAVQRTFKGTPLQAPDLMALAPKVQGVTQAVPWQEALAQFAVMREKATPDVAATSLKLFWERLQTASGTKSSEEALAKLGLAADQIDAIGEKPAEVLERLATAMDKLPKAEQAGVLKDLFGQEAMAAASGLLRDRAKVQEYLALQGDEAGFQADVGIRAAGPAAARTRVQLLQEQQAIAKNADFEEMVLAAESLQREAGIPEALLSFRRQRANLRNLMGDTSIESIAEIYTDPAQMQLPFYQRSGATLPPELLRQRILELRGEAPVDALGESASVAAAAAQVAGSPEGGAAGAAAVEIQRQQLEQLRELNRNVRPAPDRKPEGGE